MKSLIAVLVFYFLFLPVAPWLFGQDQDQFILRKKVVLPANTKDELFIRKIEDHFGQVIIPEVRLDEVPLKDALQFLQQKSVELDKNPDPSLRGISVSLVLPKANDDTAFDYSKPISLKLDQVSILTALEEVASLAGLRMRVAPHALILEPVGAPDPRLHSFSYKLSPELVKDIIKTGTVAEVIGIDPFAPPPTTELPPKILVPQNVEEALSNCGITFTHNQKVTYNKNDHILTIIANGDTIADVEQFLAYRTHGKIDIIDATTRQKIAIKERILTNAYHIEPDHWLWLHRIEKKNPNHTPKGFDTENPNFQIPAKRSARGAYEACGIKVENGETIIHTVRTSIFIAKLRESNHRRVEKINKTVDAWREGRFDEWHH